MSASLHEVMAAMRAAGVPDAQIVDAMMRLTEKDAEKADERRAADAARKRRKRAASDVSANVRRTPADAADPLPPHTPQSPVIPLPKAPLEGGRKVSPEVAKATFQRIWDVLPPQGRGCGEADGMARFGAALAKGADPAEIEAAVKAMVTAYDGRATRLDKFLDSGAWREFVPKGARPPDIAGEVRLFAADDDRRRRERRWADKVGGPYPGEPGCRAPPEILAEHGYGERKTG